MTILGDYLKELRGSLSFGDVQKETGISSSLLHRYERGTVVPSPEKLEILANFYEKSYKDLRLKHYQDIFSDPREREVAREYFTLG
jgi:transcriptional regulator with XRE-family HTH domain